MAQRRQSECRKNDTNPTESPLASDEKLLTSTSSLDVSAPIEEQSKVIPPAKKKNNSTKLLQNKANPILNERKSVDSSETGSNSRKRSRILNKVLFP